MQNNFYNKEVQIPKNKKNRPKAVKYIKIVITD